MITSEEDYLVEVINLVGKMLKDACVFRRRI